MLHLGRVWLVAEQLRICVTNISLRKSINTEITRKRNYKGVAELCKLTGETHPLNTGIGNKTSDRTIYVTYALKIQVRKVHMPVPLHG